MQKTKLLVAILGAMCAMPALAEDAPYTLTGNVGFTSDYVFRGISQNFRNATIQGGFDFNHNSGLYVGTWASNVSGNQYTNTSMEWDLYGGYNGKISDSATYNVGLVSVFYPGGKTALGVNDKKWDTTEVQAGVTFFGVNLAYHHSLTDWFGISSETGGFEPFIIANDTVTGFTTANGNIAGANLSSKGSGYIEANYSYTLPGDVTLSAHAGHQKIKNFDRLNYSDYKLGVSKAVAGFTLGVAYTKTNASDNTLTHVILPTQNKNLRGGIFALSISRSL